MTYIGYAIGILFFGFLFLGYPALVIWGLIYGAIGEYKETKEIAAKHREEANER